LTWGQARLLSVSAGSSEASSSSPAPPTHTPGAPCRALDDATYATLSSLALFNNVEVVTALAADPSFLSQLFLALEAASSSDPEWGDLVAFLQVGRAGCQHGAPCSVQC